MTATTEKIHLDRLANRIESVLARAVVCALLNAGYSVAVDNGEDKLTTPSRKYDTIIGFMAQTDDEVLYASIPGLEGRPWVKLIYGNGEDCISDFSMALDKVISPITAESVYDAACKYYDE
jgi:hypothetical protein